MKRKRFSEMQIVRILKEAETGQVPVVEICRKYAISEFTFYRWRKKLEFSKFLHISWVTIRRSCARTG
jgi:transposase-like protein